MKTKLDINKNIFREYDIRGVYEKDIDSDVSYTIGLAFGTYIKEKFGKKICVVGHDNRISSDELYSALLEGILETGCDVIGLGLVTTPMYYYACIKKEVYQGIMITASHNPKDENGFKIAFEKDTNAKGKEITDFYEFLTSGIFEYGQGTLSTYDVKNDYLELMKNSLSFGNRRVNVVIDPGNGTTSIIAKELYNMFPINLDTIYCTSDGTFPNHHPDPSVEENLTDLKKYVIENKMDVGIAFDGDGDRVGVISNSGKFIPADKYMIIIIRDIINKVEKKEFLYDIKCSKALEDEIIKLGGTPHIYRTGASYTKKGVKDFDLPFGGEFSGHVYFRDHFEGFDSGLYAGLRLLEILSKTDKTVDELLEGINHYSSTPELKFKTTDDKKFLIVRKIMDYASARGYKCITIDGVKVLFDDGFALVRASNTGPNLTARFEANSKERLESIKEEFLGVINKNL